MGKTLHRIVIVGGGAGGLELATQLGNQLGKTSQASITLIDQSLTHLWKPLWHEVAAGSLDSNVDELNFMVHGHHHSFNFLLGRMDGLDRQQKYLHLAPVMEDNGTELLPRRQIPYDTLVIAIGSISNDFNTKGAAEHCFYMDNYEQLSKFRKHFLQRFMALEQNKAVSEPLTIAIIGGGATGVELAAELKEAAKLAVHYGWAHSNLQNTIKIVILEAAATILASLPTSLINAVMTELKQRGIEVITGERAIEITDTGITTSSGMFIPAQIKVWAAGIKAPSVLKELDGLAVNRLNQLCVKSTLQTTVDEHIFAFGDCASCPQPDTDKTVPPRAQAAHQQASLLGKSLKRYLAGKPLLDFHYKDYGSLVSLSHLAAVGNLMSDLVGNFKIEGKMARLVYLLLYKSHQVRLHGLWQVCLMTLANLLTWRFKPRLKLH